MELIEAEYPKPGHVLLHLSDLHLVGGPNTLHGSVDSAARLQEICDQIIASRIRPEAIIFTGDLADKGELHAYERLREMIEPMCAALGAKAIWAMGNHDNRANFRAAFSDASEASKPQDPVDRSYFVNGLRIITLDTTVPGHHYGELSESQLEWLAAELATPAPDGTILALHHPPVPCVQDLAVLVELRGQAALAAVVRIRTFAPSWVATCITPRRRASPASRCQSPRPRVTPRTWQCVLADSVAAMVRSRTT